MSKHSIGESSRSSAVRVDNCGQLGQMSCSKPGLFRRDVTECLRSEPSFSAQMSGDVDHDEELARIVEELGCDPARIKFDLGATEPVRLPCDILSRRKWLRESRRLYLSQRRRRCLCGCDTHKYVQDNAVCRQTIRGCDRSADVSSKHKTNIIRRRTQRQLNLSRYFRPVGQPDRNHAGKAKHVADSPLESHSASPVLGETDSARPVECHDHDDVMSYHQLQPVQYGDDVYTPYVPD